MYDPFDEMMRMHEEMDNMFNRFFGRRHKMLPAKGAELAKTDDWRMPVCDVKETENNILATFELPGADKKDIDLRVTDDAIEVKVQKKAEDKKDDGYQYFSQSFYRRVPLPMAVDSDKVDATFKNGLLRIEIPKKKSSHKRIDIK